VIFFEACNVMIVLQGEGYQTEKERKEDYKNTNSIRKKKLLAANTTSESLLEILDAMHATACPSLHRTELTLSPTALLPPL
jgi:hypothetical protein